MGRWDADEEVMVRRPADGTVKCAIVGFLNVRGSLFCTFLLRRDTLFVKCHLWLHVKVKRVRELDRREISLHQSVFGKTPLYNSQFVCLFSCIIWWFSERKPACLLMSFLRGRTRKESFFRFRYGESWKVTSGSHCRLCVLPSGDHIVGAGRRTDSQKTTEEDEEMLQRIKVFFLVANSTRLRRGRLQTKVQTEIKLVWEKCRVEERITHCWTAACVCVCVWRRLACVCSIYLSG